MTIYHKSVYTYNHLYTCQSSCSIEELIVITWLSNLITQYSHIELSRQKCKLSKTELIFSILSFLDLDTSSNIYLKTNT